MNTRPTPETDKFFATFADGEAAPSHAEYYVRLQDLERERDEARETIAATLRAWQEAQEKIIAVTAQRDEAREALKTGGMLNIIDRAAHERAAAIRERDELQKAVNGLCNHLQVSPANTTLLAVEILKIERGLNDALAESIRWMSIAEGRGRTDDEEQLTTVTAQRDRLAEALLELRNKESFFLGGAVNEIVEQALQSLTPKP